MPPNPPKVPGPSSGDRTTPRKAVLVEAVAGSLVAAISLSIIFGHAVGLQTAFGWGGGEFVSPLGSCSLLFLGIVQVMLAWRDVDESGASAADGYNVVVHEFAHVIDNVR